LGGRGRGTLRKRSKNEAEGIRFDSPIQELTKAAKKAASNDSPNRKKEEVV